MSEGRAQLWNALGGNWVGEVFVRLPQLGLDLAAIHYLTRFELGVWVGVRMALQLASYLSSVPLIGLDLKYSHAAGAGDLEAARRSAGAAMLGSAALGVVTAIVLLPCLVFPSLRSTVIAGATRFELICFLMLLIVQGVYGFFVTHLRNQLRFHEVNAVQFIGNLVSMSVLVLLVPQYRVVGAIVAFGSGMLVCISVWTRRLDVKFIDRSELLRVLTILCRLGLSLVAATIAMTCLRLMARWFIAQNLGVAELGLYGIASIFAGVVFLAGGSSSRVVMQFAARAEGAGLARDAQAVQYGLVPASVVAGVSALACFAVQLAAILIIPRWSPEQADVLAVLPVVLSGSVLFGVVFILATMLRAQGRQKELVLITGGLLACHCVLLTVMTFTLRSFWSYAAAEVVTLAGLAVVLVWRIEAPAEVRRWFIAMLTAVTVSTGFGLQAGVEFTSSLRETLVLQPALIHLAFMVGVAVICMSMFYRGHRCLKRVGTNNLTMQPSGLSDSIRTGSDGSIREISQPSVMAGPHDHFSPTNHARRV